MNIYRLAFLLLLLAQKDTVVLGQHSLQKLAYPVNTDAYDEICPVTSYEQDVLFFTRVADPNCEKSLWIDSIDVYFTKNDSQYFERLQFVYSQLAGKKVDDPWSSSFNQDIWYTLLKNGNTEGIFHPGFPINDALT